MRGHTRKHSFTLIVNPISEVCGFIIPLINPTPKSQKTFFEIPKLAHYA